MLADLLVLHADQLLTIQGSSPRRGDAQSEVGLMTDGAVACHRGEILAVGPTEELLSAVETTEDAQIIDARGMVLTPGLVDPHTHLVFAGTREREFELRARGASYAEIMEAGGGIHSTVERTRQASDEELREHCLKHLQVMLEHGTTTVEAKSGYGLDLDTEIKQLNVLMEASRRHPVDVVPTFMGAHAVPRGMDPDAYVEWLVSEAIPKVAIRGIARFCDVFCEKGVFTPEQSETILRAAIAQGLGAKIHADELADTGGAALAARVGAVSADHLHHANTKGLAAMAEAGTVAVLLPGTAVFLGMREHAKAREMIAMGLPVALATDFNPGSCYSESMPLMMSFACTQLGLTPAEALVASTLNAAAAVGRAHRVGSIEPRKQADMVLWNVPDYRHIAYHMGINHVRTVIKRGEVAYERDLPRRVGRAVAP